MKNSAITTFLISFITIVGLLFGGLWLTDSKILVTIAGFIVGIFFFGMLFLVLFYSLLPVWDGYMWKRSHKKKIKLKTLIMPISGMLSENYLEEVTESLNKRIKIRLGDKIDNIRTITTSIGADGVCYITVWYEMKEHAYREYGNHLTNTLGFKM